MLNLSTAFVICEVFTILVNTNTLNSGADFHLLRRCQRSTATVIEWADAESLNDCKRIARTAKGLAFNFAADFGINERNLFDKRVGSANGTYFPQKESQRHILEQPEQFYKCLVLDCSETVNFTKMANDSRFDYYSLYADPPPPINSSCIPQIGMFQIHTEAKNYSSAYATCSNESQGALAHVASETRTRLISQLLATKIPRNLAYIGLNATRSPRQRFETADRENLDAFLFAAWEVGFPRFYDQTCAVLTRKSSWKTVNCSQELPFICEIYTSGTSQEAALDFCQFL